VVTIPAADAEVMELQLAMESMSRAVVEREDRLRSQARVLETLEWVQQSFATELDFDKAVAAVTQAAQDLTGSEAAGLFQKQTGAEDGLRLVAEAGNIVNFPITESDPLIERTLLGEVVDIRDVAVMAGVHRRRPLSSDETLTVRSFLGIPITSRSGEVQGCLVLVHSNAEAFGDYQERLATGLARRASIVIENATLYSEARKVQEELRKANVAKDEFIGMISHELRTPITTIYGGARLIQTRSDSLPKEALEEMIDSIESESERLYRLVEDLLAIARTDLGREVANEIVALNPVVDQVVKQFSNRYPTRRIDLEVPRNLPAIKAESSYVHQVLHNLLTNADKYSPADQPIEIEANATEEEVTLRIQDHGPGVAPEELDQIFDSFYRSEKTSKQASGKGLGLTVCKRLVEAMGGRIWATNREGGGLIVHVTLPVVHEILEGDSDAPEINGARSADTAQPV
jgi:K+-sensing histidine kinase KdpD